MDLPPVGVILAGGAGRRMGASGSDGDGKAMVQLAGRPLIEYPAAVLGAVCDRLAVVCKEGTPLPTLAGWERWDEPDEPRHPLTGLVHALEQARGPVLVCAVDMPFVTVADLRVLWREAAAHPRAGAVVASSAGGPQPTLAVYAPATLPVLRTAPPDAPLRRTVRALEPRCVELPGASVRQVNTPEDLVAAEMVLAAH